MCCWIVYALAKTTSSCTCLRLCIEGLQMLKVVSLGSTDVTQMANSASEDHYHCAVVLK